MNRTIIYYTPNYENETFASRVREHLLSVKGDLPLISVSQRPLDFGRNINVGEIGRSFSNVYRQMLTGIRAAKTDYVIMAEDDTLYPPEHFSDKYLPPLDTFAYNMCRWSVCTWVRPPVYTITQRLCNSNLIAPRKLLIELLEKRFAYKGEASKLWSEPAKHDAEYGLGTYKIFKFLTKPVVSFIHPQTLAYGFLGRRKKLNPIQAYDIPYWGRVDKLMTKFYES